MRDTVERHEKNRSRLFRRVSLINVLGVVAILVAASLITAKNLQGDTSLQLLNVSYDPTRELYTALDADFIDQYQKQTGTKLQIKQSHGGSSRQARSVIDGEQKADVVTLALPTDIDALRKRDLIAADWQSRLPNNAQPYSSTVVFVVRKGNPKAIHDWPDLIKDDVSIVTPDPHSSGNGKLSILAAWGSVTARGGSEADALAYLKSLYTHVAVFDPGARSAADRFTIEKVGDVHLTWENEALREVSVNKDELELVHPPISIKAEPAVAVVDANVKDKKVATYAAAYLQYLFTDRAQDIIAQYGYRPIKTEIGAKYSERLPDIQLFPIKAVAKDWHDAQERFFGDNGIFDTLVPAKAK